MSRVLSESLVWLKRQALSYLVIFLILLAGSWIWKEWRHASALAAQSREARAAVQAREAEVERALARLDWAEQALEGRLAALRLARDAARQALAAKEREQESHRQAHWPWPGLYGPEALAHSRRLHVEVNALRRAAHEAQEQLQAAEALHRSSVEWRQLKEQALQHRAEAQRLRARWLALRDAHPIAQRLPWGPVGTELDRLKAEIERLQQDAVAAEKAVAAAGQSPEMAEWLRSRTALEAVRARLREAEARWQGLDDALAQSAYPRWRDRVGRFLDDQSALFLLALAVLAGTVLARLAVKGLLFFVVAPLASRHPPVRLLEPGESSALARAPGGRAERISAESVGLRLWDDDELLVRPEYLQSSPTRARKRTAWLLDPALPFTSLLSGMVLLTRVRSAGGQELVLSPGRDPFDELCLVELPAGSALVCQPRALAGVVQPVGQPLRITRHWRWRSLHAWLTLQLRFLVFHGPGKLVLKGRRGIRMEAAGSQRMINQAATLAFDAGVPYATVRTETFVPYWLGKEGLFDDRFAGREGSYFYEERPLDRRGNALVGRGLEGLLEGVLKVFGI